MFALNQVSLRLMNDFSAGNDLLFDEAAPTFLLFLALWELRAVTVGVTSRVHTDAPPVQNMRFIAMVGAVVMAVVVAQGFEGQALVFAGAYMAAPISRLLVVPMFRLRQRVSIPAAVLDRRERGAMDRGRARGPAS